MLLEQIFRHLPPEGKQNLADNVAGHISDQGLHQLAECIDIGFLCSSKVAGEKRLSRRWRSSNQEPPKPV